MNPPAKSKKNESSSKAGGTLAENQNESSIPDDTKRGIHAGRHEGTTLSTRFVMPRRPQNNLTIATLTPLVTRRRVLNCLAAPSLRLSQNRREKEAAADLYTLDLTKEGKEGWIKVPVEAKKMPLYSRKGAACGSSGDQVII
ncbi:hypothetical protein BGX34_003659 [Mortierella sp. NVP85]|nr:hypothetical protein BGX34_003659 [Mortierella sp. NVP85]